MIKFRSIIPVSLFKKDTKEYLTRLEVMSGPIMLTVHGRGAFVLEHVNSYMDLAELAHSAGHFEAMHQALKHTQEISE